ALDRAVINQVAFDGAFIPSNQPEAPGTPFHAANLPIPGRDLARARALVAQAGGGRVPVSFMIGSDPLDRRVAEIIQAMAGEAGVGGGVGGEENGGRVAKNPHGKQEPPPLDWSGRARARAQNARCGGVRSRGY